MMQCPSPLLPMLIDEFGLAHWQVGMLYAAPVAIITLFSYPLGIVSDRVGIEKAVAIGSIIAAASTILRGLCSNFVTLGAMTVLFGFGFALGLTNLSKIIKTHFPSALAGTATGIYATGMPLGSGTSIAVTKPFLSWAGAHWPMAFWTWGLFGLVPPLIWLGVCLLIHRRSPGEALQSSATADPALNDVTPSSRQGFMPGPRRNPVRANSHPFDRGRRRAALNGRERHLMWSLVISGILLSLLNLMFFCTVGWLPTYLDEKGFGSTSAALLTSMIPFIEVPAVVVVPMVSDRTGRKRELLAASYLVMALGTALLAFDPRVILTAILLLGITFGGSFALLMATPAELTGVRREHTARTAGVLLSIGYTGALAGPPLAGQLRDATGSFTYSFLFLAAAAMVAAVFCYWLPTKSIENRNSTATSTQRTRP